MKWDDKREYVQKLELRIVSWLFHLPLHTSCPAVCFVVILLGCLFWKWSECAIYVCMWVNNVPVRWLAKCQSTVVWYLVCMHGYGWLFLCVHWQNTQKNRCSHGLRCVVWLPCVWIRWRLASALVLLRIWTRVAMAMFHHTLYIISVLQYYCEWSKKKTEICKLLLLVSLYAMMMQSPWKVLRLLKPRTEYLQVWWLFKVKISSKCLLY